MLCQEYFESKYINRAFATLSQITPYKADVPIQTVKNNVCSNDKKKNTLNPSFLDVLEKFPIDESNNNKSNHLSGSVFLIH